MLGWRNSTWSPKRHVRLESLGKHDVKLDVRGRGSAVLEERNGLLGRHKTTDCCFKRFSVIKIRGLLGPEFYTLKFRGGVPATADLGGHSSSQATERNPFTESKPCKSGEELHPRTPTTRHLERILNFTLNVLTSLTMYIENVFEVRVHRVA